MRDFKRMQTDPPAGVSASPIADNVMTWCVQADGTGERCRVHVG